MKTSFFLVLMSYMFFGIPALQAAEKQPSQLSTHMLDISLGKPAPDVPVTLYKWNETGQNWEEVRTEKTGENGRIDNLLSAGTNNEGTYKLKFETQDYFKAQNLISIYPYVEIVFELTGKEHYHIPITMSANGYSTYRGN